MGDGFKRDVLDFMQGFMAVVGLALAGVAAVPLVRLAGVVICAVQVLLDA